MVRQNNKYYRNRSDRAISSFNGLLSWLQNIVRTRRDSISSRTFLLSLLVFLLAVTLCTQIIARQVEEARLEYRVDLLRERNLELRMQVHSERIEVSQLQRLDRIQWIAVSELGMEMVDTVPLLELDRRRWAQLPLEGGGEEGIE